ncbi:ABC transporter permease [Butyrivibrio sp. LB2008]|uniref:ABC transporter permease n=1 Tax=Butyrivibrio sp. LB2008 TaxID=1408305 RepID=UPI00047A1FD8|nr:ABC transporter permease subunit [Butyrivibrio sp. LB2008]
MLKLIKIELVKVIYGKSVWISILCALLAVLGFGILMNMDDAFDDYRSQEEIMLEEKYENSNDWKEKLEIQMELNQLMSDVYSQEKIDMDNSILEYEINNDLEPYAHNTTWDFIAYTFRILNVVLIIISIWITTEMIMSEYVNKTYKLVYTKAYKRWEIYVSKYISSIITISLIAVMMLIMAWIVGGIIFGFDGISSRTAICLYGKMMAISLGGKAMLYMAFAIVKAIAVSSIAFLIAELTKNQVIAVIVTIVCSFWGKMLLTKIINNGVAIGKYSLFMHYDLVSFIDSPIVYNGTAMISATIIAVHLILFLVFGMLVNKGEDL